MIAGLVELTLQGAVVFGLAVLALALLGRRASAALRHATWATALGLSLVLVPLAFVAPVVRLPVAWPTPGGASAALEALDRLALVPFGDGRTPPSPRPDRAGAARGFVLAIWAAGSGLLLLRAARSACALGRLRRAARPLADARAPAIADGIRRRLGLASPVELLESDLVPVPLVLGAWRPAVVLPAGTSGWPVERLEVVLAHELAHVRRGDVRAQLVAEVARAVHWPDPLAWLAWRRLLAEREQACDDEVVRGGARPADYAGHLLDLARVAVRPSGAAPLAELAGLPGRVHALLAPGARRERIGPVARLGLGATAAGLTLGFTLFGGAPDAPGSAPVKAQARVRPHPISPARIDPVAASPLVEDAVGNVMRTAASEAPPASPLPALPDDPRSERIELVEARGSWPSDEEIARAPERDALLALRTAADHVKQFEHDYVAERATWALTRVREGRIVGPLVESLGDPDARIRSYAAWSLAAIGAREAAGEIRPLLDDGNARVRAQGAAAILALEGTLPADRLERLTADPAWQVRILVVEALAARGDGSARTLLERMRDDPHGGTRLAVEDALVRVGG